MNKFIKGAFFGFLAYLIFIGISILLGLPFVLGYIWGIILIVIGAVFYPLLKRKHK